MFSGELYIEVLSRGAFKSIFFHCRESNICPKIDKLTDKEVSEIISTIVPVFMKAGCFVEVMRE